MGNITVVMNPEQRDDFIEMILKLDGLSHIKEDPRAAYCPISLTSVPDEIKSFLQIRQEILMNDILRPAGITAYDPATAPFSPDAGLTIQPNVIYTTDSGKIAGARFFVGHDILPSDGKGIEREKAKTMIRIPVMLIDAGIRVSRMQPHRTIYLQYNNFEEQAGEFVSVFEMLQKYEPGIGLNGDLPVLLGFERTCDRIVDLEELVYRKFPNLQYVYDGKVPILKLRVKNPELFYENR